jgi:hypothetical protein
LRSEKVFIEVYIDNRSIFVIIYIKMCSSSRFDSKSFRVKYLCRINNSLSSTNFAREHLALTVDKHVLLQVGVGGERLVAARAHERLHLLVNLEQGRKGLLRQHWNTRPVDGRTFSFCAIGF